MREIKFRAWDSEANKMLDGDYIEESECCKAYLSYGVLCIAVFEPDYDETSSFHTSNGRYLWLVNNGEVIGNIYEHPHLLEQE